MRASLLLLLVLGTAELARGSSWFLRSCRVFSRVVLLAAENSENWFLFFVIGPHFWRKRNHESKPQRRGIAQERKGEGRGARGREEDGDVARSTGDAGDCARHGVRGAGFGGSEPEVSGRHPYHVSCATADGMHKYTTWVQAAQDAPEGAKQLATVVAQEVLCIRSARFVPLTACAWEFYCV